MRVCMVQHNFPWRGEVNSQYFRGMVGGFFNSHFLGLLTTLTYSGRDVIVESFFSIELSSQSRLLGILRGFEHFVCMYVF